MRRRLTDEDAAFRARMHHFFTETFPQELCVRWREGGEVRADDVRASQRFLNEHGLAVPHWPLEYGGQDWTSLQRHIYLQEMERAAVPPPLTFNANMVGPVLAAFGSDEQKQRFLPPTANLDIWWCQGFSEPDAGSDLASLRTSATRDKDAWVVNGQKTWTTLGQHADWIFALVRTNPSAPKKQMGISFLLIDMHSPGITVRPIRLIDGGHEVNEVFFDDVRVPADQLVGEVDQGWSYAKFLLGNERVGIAQIGTIQRKLADAKQFAASVQTDAGSLLDDPLVSARIADLECQVMALELTAIRVAAGSKDGKPDPASSILKLRGSQLQQAVSELVTDVAGPSGLWWWPAEGGYLEPWMGKSTPTYLNLRKTSIYGGSNEVQRQIISSGILGLRS